MRHDYVDIPSLPEPLQSKHWERQRISEELRKAQQALNLAQTAFTALLLDHIKINDEIRELEQ